MTRDTAEPDSDDPIRRIVSLLEDARRVGGEWRARCPGHPDRTPSLAVTKGDDGRALILCRAGCPTEAVLAALGLAMADLFPAKLPSQPKRRIVATYPYRAADGADLFEVVREQPKAFRQRRRLNGQWVWNVRGIERVLYRLPELLASEDTDVLVVEGEKDVERLRAAGFTATTSPGGATKWKSTFNEALRGRHVTVLPDNDEPGRRHATMVEEQLTGVASSVAVLELPGLPEAGDASDWLDTHGTADALRQLVQRAHERAGADASPAAPAACSLAAALDMAVAHLLRFVHFARPQHADAVALWAAHTHAPLDRLSQSPILVLTSPVKRSGKTRLLDVLEHMVRQPWRIARPTEAVLFRKISRDHPTLLLDEADTIFGDRAAPTEGIRAVFNNGNRRGTTVPRTVRKGDAHDLEEFEVFCPKAVAGIGGLPDTVLDRSIVIHMERKSRLESVERLREHRARMLGRPIAEALSDTLSRVTDFTLDDAVLPDELDDRAQDGCEPLLAIADSAGSGWGARARAAAVLIHQEGARTDAPDEIQMLADCRQVFALDGRQFIPTTALRSTLLELPESRWLDVRGRPITPHKIGQLLHAFDIRSARQRLDPTASAVHGYVRSDFADAWSRNLPPESDTSGTSGTAGGRERSVRRERGPDVPNVPDTDRPRLWPWQTPGGDDDEWVIGTA